MPTHEETSRFLADLRALTPEQQTAFRTSLRKFIADLRVGRFRKGLRVKRVRGRPGIWEMTWADNGRALFRYGPSVRPGERHVIWLRIGGHEIFEDR